MDRKFTNMIRYLMDECLPPLLRDSRWFMWPFFYYAYRGKHIQKAMNFKSIIHSWSAEEYAQYYNEIDTISRNRATDLNSECVRLIVENIHPASNSVLDVGCAKGYLLQKLQQEKPRLSLHGCDVKKTCDLKGVEFLHGQLQDLNLPNQSYDTVICCHTLEHILDPKKFVVELERLCKKQLIVVVPCQRYYYYTLDEHVNFFHYKEQLTSLFAIQPQYCEVISGDWLCIFNIS